MLAIRGSLGSGTTNYMMFDPAVGPWRTVSLSLFGNYDTNGTYRYFTEIFKPIYDFTIVNDGLNEIATARFPTGVRIKLNLLKPEYFSIDDDGELTYAHPYFWADGVAEGTGAGPGLNEPWRLIELNLANVPFTEIKVANNGLQLLDVSENQLLKHLDFSLNNLTDLTFNMSNSGWAYENEGEMVRLMQTLRGRSNSLTIAPFIAEPDAVVFDDYDVANNNITTIAVANPPPQRFDVSNQFPNSATQGLTSLSFADGVNRPGFWYVQNNRLTSLDLGISGGVEGSGWGAVSVLDCSNNLISELVFPDGPPLANYWDRGTTPGGYRLASLDVSNNQLTALDVRHVDTLLDLVVTANAPLTSLTLAPNPVVTYDNNDSGVNLLWDEQGNPVPDAITGDWTEPPLGSTFINNSYFYRHTRGVRRLIVRDCPLLQQISSTAAHTTALGAVRELDISGSGVVSLPISAVVPIFGLNSGGNINFATYVAQPGGFRLSGTVPSGSTGASSGTSYQTLAHSYMYDSSRFAVSFRNLTFSGSSLAAGQEFLRNNVAYMLHSALRESNNVTTYYFRVTDRHDLEKQAPSNIDTSTTTGGQVAIYNISGGMPFLETFTAENCSGLTTLSLIGCPLLKKVVIKNCPNLGSGDTNPPRSVLPGFSWTTERWGGVSGNITHLEIENCPNVNWVIREQAPHYRMNFDRLSISNVRGVFSGQGQIRVGRAAQFSGDSSGGGVNGGVICRNGIWLTNNAQMTFSDVETFLLRLGPWSFTPSLLTDSNVISFAGTPYPLSRKASVYDARKATATSLGWQVIDPTFV